jgi:hypothetical protein
VAIPRIRVGIPPGYESLLQKRLPCSGYASHFASSTARHRLPQVDAPDKLGISHALQLRDRIRHVDLHIPHSSLHKLLALMDEPFPNLEHITLSSTGDGDSSLILPKNFLAPNLRHFRLSRVGLPGDLTLLSTASLLTLTLTNIQTSRYILPKHLVTLLQSSPRSRNCLSDSPLPYPLPAPSWHCWMYWSLL